MFLDLIYFKDVVLMISICFFFLQISPIILNTVMTITAAMRAKTEQQKEEVKLEVGDLWSVSDIYNCNYWFLGVEEATEVTESFQEASSCNEGEKFSAQIKVPHGISETIITPVTFFSSLLADGFSPVACFKFFPRTPYRCDRTLFPCYKTGVPGDAGIWSGASDCPTVAGRVLFQWTGQKLVISSPADR